MQTTLTIFAIAMALWLAFPAGAGKAAGLESAAESQAAPVTIVILPPDVKAEDAETRVAAELLCDRLAERLGDIAGIRVVDRTQIDRVLAEHALARKPAGPVLAYDAMVRVSVDALVPLPRVRLSVIDLSHGNVIGFTEQHWHIEMSPEALSEMVEVCASAVESLVTKVEGRLKVRFPGVVPVGSHGRGDSRLEHLAIRLQQTVEELLSRTPSVQLVHHVEAATAKEESLLILMGLSRLPGGRHFAPQADVSLALEVREVGAVGKTFDETGLEIRFCLAREDPAEWQTLRGKMGKWDDLTVNLWEVVSAQLAGVDAKEGVGFLNEMTARRYQAQMELAKLRSLGAFRSHAYSSLKSMFPVEKMELWAETAAKVLKLDPTCQDAAFVSLKFNYYLRRRLFEPHRTAGPDVGVRELLEPTLKEALGYLSQYPGSERYREEVADVIFFATYDYLSDYYSPGAAPPDVDTMDRIRRLADFSLAVPLHPFCDRWEDGGVIGWIYDNMVAAGMSPEPCRRWRDRALEIMDAKLLDARKRGRVSESLFEERLPQLRTVAIRYALDEGNAERAEELLIDVMRLVPEVPPWLAKRILPSVERLGNPELVERVANWGSSEDLLAGVKLLQIKWPCYDLGLTPECPRIPSKEVHAWVQSGPSERSSVVAVPVAAIGERLYLFYAAQDVSHSLGLDFPTVLKEGVKFGYLSLDEQGAPVGEEVTPLTSPKVARASVLSAPQVVTDRLCLGTDRSGLLVYDPGKDEWASYTPECGLPRSRVAAFSRLGDGMLFCRGGWRGSYANYTLDVKSGDIVLRQETDQVVGAWRAGDKWFAVCHGGISEDILALDPHVFPWPGLTPQGWVASRGASRMVTTEAGHFVQFRDTLVQVGDEGQTLRVWTMDYDIDLTRQAILRRGAHYGPWRYHVIGVPGEVPLGTLSGGDGPYLYFVNTSTGMTQQKLVCFDPAADTWYGPVVVDPLLRQAVAVRGVLWGNGRDSGTPLRFVAWEDVIAAARRAGQAVTTEEHKRRCRQMMGAAPLLDRAKYALALREFDKAKESLAQVLAKEPQNPEALLLMGLLHESFSLNDGNAALEYYDQLSQHSDPSAALTGMYYQARWYQAAGDPAAAMEICQRILARFRFAPGWRYGILGLIAELRREANAAPSAATAGEP